MRGGTLHLVPADEVADYCAALSTLRFWEKGSWQRGHAVTAGEISAIIDAVPGVLGGPPLTREELVEAVVAATGQPHLTRALTSGWRALLKPLSRLGELCHGPPREGRVTFTTPRTWLPGWAGTLPPPALRPKVSRQAGWISPVVVHEGRIAGVWEVRDGTISLDLATPVPQGPLDDAVARMRDLLP
ncbi:crosslink repair DNA glycosylase YcaQ family protein [Nonomuraea sp. B12E4]|uniref:DNA glycosylase AlkZ-like family protein n=1 Tax=Nonomuraea sp. B12E4 TaxID=3153564 RepID=UPI00325C5432